MRILVFSLSFFLCFNLSCLEIRTVDIVKIIDNNKQYQIFLNLINKKKNSIKIIISNKENEIKNDELYIENNKLIINQNDLNTKIESLNANYLELESYINNYNYYFDKNININKQILLNTIAEISKNLSIENNIDIILDKSNYFIASNHIDFTDLIMEKTNNININFNLLDEGEIFEN